MRTPPLLTLFFFFLVIYLFSLSFTAANATTLLSQHFREAPQFYNSPDCPSLIEEDNEDDDDASEEDSNGGYICSDLAVHFSSTPLVPKTSSFTSWPPPPPTRPSYAPPSPPPSPTSASKSTASMTPPWRGSSPLQFAPPRLPPQLRRSYLANILPFCVRRVVYLDSDLVWSTTSASSLPPRWEIAQSWPHRSTGNANFTTYFTPTFWSNPSLSLTFANRKACYFNTGVMVIDLDRWRAGDYTSKIEDWMELQKRMRYTN
ncbi:putative galacturonosyltransferase-like 2 [Vitis vinifera]|uniref:Hexosyltransferase n=1 Tax=Vitis vinifera TaxID=29760 RepID=A0A438ERR4_VITVI|nr:putative galacturonosyltransferase-like 2 [Vitis vinifera]